MSFFYAKKLVWNFHTYQKVYIPTFGIWRCLFTYVIAPHITDFSRKLITCVDVVDRILKISELENIAIIVDIKYDELFKNVANFLWNIMENRFQ